MRVCVWSVSKRGVSPVSVWGIGCGRHCVRVCIGLAHTRQATYSSHLWFFLVTPHLSPISPSSPLPLFPPTTLWQCLVWWRWEHTAGWCSQCTEIRYWTTLRRERRRGEGKVEGERERENKGGGEMEERKKVGAEGEEGREEVGHDKISLVVQK